MHGERSGGEVEVRPLQSEQLAQPQAFDDFAKLAERLADAADEAERRIG